MATSAMSGGIANPHSQSTNSLQPIPPQQSPTAFDTFTCFPRLPPELRLKVWKFAIDEPRVLRYAVISTRPPYEFKARDFFPPAVLHANRESRIESQKIVEWKVDETRKNKFFRNDVDIAFLQADQHFKFGWGWDYWLFHQNPFEKAKNMAITSEMWERVTSSYRIYHLLMSVSCRNLVIVIKDRAYEYWKLGKGKNYVPIQEGRVRLELRMEAYEKDVFMKADMDGMEWEDDMVIPRAGELVEVVYNKEYARALEAQIARQKRSSLEYIGPDPHEAWHVSKAMELKAMELNIKVLSE